MKRIFISSASTLTLLMLLQTGHALAQDPALDAPALDEGAAPWVAPLIEHTDGKWTGDHDLKGRDRSRLAFANTEALVEQRFANAGVAFPPAQLLFRAFKKESVMEIWANDRSGQPMTHVATYQICYMSGDPGPKRQEGDLQIPEGYYEIDLLYNRSAFYLSMRVNYPNKSDTIIGRALRAQLKKDGVKNPPRLGHSIMIHGDCVSIGCMAMSDERIQELWVMGKQMERKKRKIEVHVLPQRDVEALIKRSDDAEMTAFWTNIKQGYDQFETTRVLPVVSVGRDGAYRFR